jgi:hypothetical protein
MAAEARGCTMKKIIILAMLALALITETASLYANPDCGSCATACNGSDC